MRIVLVALVGVVVCLVVVQEKLIHKVKLLKEHTEVCGATLKEQGYALDVLTELVRAK